MVCVRVVTVGFKETTHPPGLRSVNRRRGHLSLKEPDPSLPPHRCQPSLQRRRYKTGRCAARSQTPPPPPQPSRKINTRPHPRSFRSGPLRQHRDSTMSPASLTKLISLQFLHGVPGSGQDPFDILKQCVVTLYNLLQPHSSITFG